MLLETFKCGHWYTPENIASNGGPRGGCRTCKNARARIVATTPEGRRSAALRTAKWRGVEPGRSHGVFNASKTECSNGHPYSKENTYVFKGWRQCVKCRYARTTAYYHRKRANGGDHTEEQWEALCELSDQRCAMCRQKKKLTRDHIVPVSKGGSNDITNIQPLCRPCNSGKKDRLVTIQGAQ